MHFALHTKTCLLLFLISLGVTLGVAADNQVKATIISTHDVAAPGASVTVGIHFSIPERAHIYWRNPGDSGIATGVEWTVPESVTVGELNWPVPKSFTVEGLDDEVYFGYEEKTMLFAKITIPDDAKQGTEIIIRANAYWLVCLDDGVCIPEDVDLELSIAIDSESKSSSFSDAIEEYRSEVPGRLSNTDSPIRIDWADSPDTSFTVSTKGKSLFAADTTLYGPTFYPYTGGGWLMEFSESHALLSTVVFRPNAESATPTGGVLVFSLKGDSESAARRYAIEVQAPELP